MSISTELQFAHLDDLFLDPMNPRLGRNVMKHDLSQEKILELMEQWTLDELALSYLENGGFWTHEALIVIQEALYGSPKLIVVEGNRRLAALKLLNSAINGNPTSRKWEQLAKVADPPNGLFERIPYVLADTREDVQAFLGFRHVTGIKQWDADEKAGFIAQLIDEQGLTYEEVMRKIGSKTPVVRRNYIAYRLLLQLEESVEDFDAKSADKRFAILYMSIEKEGVQRYLNIDISADPATAKRPVSEEKLQQLANFARWLFGTENMAPLVTDTRQTDLFGKILSSSEAIEYLEKTSKPNFDVAVRIAGGDENEIISYVDEAANFVELALSRVHFYSENPMVEKGVKRLVSDVLQLLTMFPRIRAELLKEKE